MKISEAFVEVRADPKPLTKELKMMESAVKKSTDRMKKNFARIGKGVSEISRTARYGFLGITAAIAGSVYAFAKMGDEIHKMSIRTGIAATELSALGYAARISGSSLDTVERSLRYLSARLYDADQGLAEAKRAFEELGIEIYNADGSLRTTVGVLKEFADKVTTMTDETKKAALAGEIFGMRYGPMLLPLLEEGSEGITELMNKAEELGITIDTSSAAAAAEFTDRMEDMKGAVLGLTREIGEIFLPVFRNAVVVIIDKVKEWREAIVALTPEQKKLIAQVVLLGTAALGAIGALGLFAKVAALVTAAGSVIAGVAGLIASPLGLLVVLLGTMAAIWILNWDKMAAELRNLWMLDIKPVLEALWDWLVKIKDWTLAKFEWTLEKIGEGWDAVKEFFVNAKEWLKPKFEWLLEKTGATWEEITTFFADVYENWLKPTLKWTLERVGAGWLAFTEFLIKAGSWISQAFYWTLKKVGEGWDWFKGIMQWVKMHAEFAFNWLLEKVGASWTWLEETLWPWVKKWAVNTYEWGLKLIGDIYEWLKNTLIPWTTEFASKTFEWTLNLLGDAWDKIKEIRDWLTKLWRPEPLEIDTSKVTESLEEVKETVAETTKILEKLVPKKTGVDIERMEAKWQHFTWSIEESAAVWGIYNQEMKQKIGLVAAELWLFKDEALKVAKETPEDFALKWNAEFMKKKPTIQRAILKAIAARDFERALGLMGGDFADAILYGASPGGLIPGLEEGTKDLQGSLDKMLGSMGTMVDTMAKIFNPIIGLFKKIFEGVIVVIKKFDEDAGTELENFVNETFAIIEGLFSGFAEEVKKLPPVIHEMIDTFGQYIEKLPPWWRKIIEDIKKGFKSLADAAKVIWGDAFEAIGRAGFVTVVDIIRGVKTMEEAFLEFARKLQTIVADALLNLAVVAAKTGKGITAVFLGLAALIVATIDSIMKAIMGIGEAAENVQTAWGAFFSSWTLGARDMEAYLKDLADIFSEVGLAISNTIEASQRKLQGLYKSIEDLGKNTREKLIDELDKYYDYRELRDMDLTELLALSAKTREEIEKGTLEEVAETAKEAAEREKDAKVDALQAIEDAHQQEIDLINQRILLTKIEIKLFEIQNTNKRWNMKEWAKLQKELNDLLDEYDEKYTEVGKTTENVTKATKEATRATREYGEVGLDMSRKARLGFDQARIGIELWGEEINRLPKKIDFEVIGHLDIPSIPHINPRYFDIIGTYRAPNIASAQIGIPYIPRPMIVKVHPEEAILNPPQAEQWRRGGEPKVLERRTVEQNITIQSLFPPDDPVLWDRIWREGLRAAAERESGRRVV